MGNTLWILTEERPKQAVIKKIVSILAKDQSKRVSFEQHIQFIPLFDSEKKFKGEYRIDGITFENNSILDIKLKIISGNSSFVDYLVYLQAQEPVCSDEPIYAIEETKTDDSESRNTGVFQRISKFVYVSYYYPKCEKIMLYSLQIAQKEIATATNDFGNRLLLTLGVRLEGKNFDQSLIPFKTVDDLIKARSAIRRPPKGNVPINVKKLPDKIQISGRLVKSGRLGHDPNIGALSGIAACIRILGYEGSIELIQHGLKQGMLKPNNKFMRIVDKLDLQFEGLRIPADITWPETYWKYEVDSEKLGSIFLHLVVESLTSGYSLFENHAGCEKGYFLCADNSVMPIEKYKNRALYKAGDKNEIIHIPDLVLLDPENMEIINIEAKQSKFSNRGIEELKNFDAFEEKYIHRYYPNYTILRTVVLYGDTRNHLTETEIGFVLNKQGVIRIRGNIKLINNAMDRVGQLSGFKMRNCITKDLNPDISS